MANARKQYGQQLGQKLPGPRQQGNVGFDRGVLSEGLRRNRVYDGDLQRQLDSLEGGVAESLDRIENLFPGSFHAEDQVYPLATRDGGWIDIIGNVSDGSNPPPTIAPAAPLGFLRLPRFNVGNSYEYHGHIPHGINPSEGLFFHVHCFVDGTATNSLKFQFEYTYAHGYKRQTFPASKIVTAEQTPSGTAQQHMIIETEAPVLVDEIETDGVVMAECTRITNGGIDNPNNVFVYFIDTHAKLRAFISENKNYPFGL